MKYDFNIYTYVHAYETMILIITRTYVYIKFSYDDSYVRTYVPIIPAFYFCSIRTYEWIYYFNICYVFLNISVICFMYFNEQIIECIYVKWMGRFFKLA